MMSEFSTRLFCETLSNLHLNNFTILICWWHKNISGFKMYDCNVAMPTWNDWDLLSTEHMKLYVRFRRFKNSKRPRIFRQWRPTLQVTKRKVASERIIHS